MSRSHPRFGYKEATQRNPKKFPRRNSSQIKNMNPPASQQEFHNVLPHWNNQKGKLNQNPLPN